MDFAPETQILILNGVIPVVAYFGIYPSLEHKTMNRIMTIDVVLSVLALSVAGALFWGTGTAFNLILFDVNWAVFTVVTLSAIEAPLFGWFIQRHNISLHDDQDS